MVSLPLQIEYASSACSWGRSYLCQFAKVTSAHPSNTAYCKAFTHFCLQMVPAMDLQRFLLARPFLGSGNSWSSSELQCKYKRAYRGGESSRMTNCWAGCQTSSSRLATLPPVVIFWRCIVYVNSVTRVSNTQYTSTTLTTFDLPKQDTHAGYFLWRIFQLQICQLLNNLQKFQRKFLVLDLFHCLLSTFLAYCTTNTTSLQTVFIRCGTTNATIRLALQGWSFHRRMCVAQLTALYPIRSSILHPSLTPTVYAPLWYPVVLSKQRITQVTVRHWRGKNRRTEFLPR